MNYSILRKGPYGRFLQRPNGQWRCFPFKLKWMKLRKIRTNDRFFFHLSPLGWIPVLLFCFLSFVARIFFISAKFCLLWRIASLTVRYLTKSLATQGKLDLFGIKGKEAQQDPCSVPGLWKRYFTAFPTNRAQPFLNSTFWVCNLASHVC